MYRGDPRGPSRPVSSCIDPPATSLERWWNVADRVQNSLMGGHGDSTVTPMSGGGGAVEPVLVTMRFESERPDVLLDVLSRYVVLARAEPGCRNVDLVASVTVEGRFLVVSKWATMADQQRHLDSEVLAALARDCQGLLRAPPELDLYDGVSMHDLA